MYPTFDCRLDLCPAIPAMVFAAAHLHPLEDNSTVGVFLCWPTNGLIPRLNCYTLPPPHQFRDHNPASPGVPTPNRYGSHERFTTALEYLLFCRWKSRVAVRKEGLVFEGQNLLMYDGPSQPQSAHHRLAMAPYLGL